MCDTLIFCISYKKMTIEVIFRGALNIFAFAEVHETEVHVSGEIV